MQRAVETITAAATAVATAVVITAVRDRRRAVAERRERENRRREAELEQVATESFEFGMHYGYRLPRNERPPDSDKLAQVLRLPTQRNTRREADDKVNRPVGW